ncbi:ESX secretion-associated protein EspG [Nocardia flavorosea]|uniref:ESX secretion-associated protein EspG n=1 Tax=Nocardia flavorosea TaxID=53429 RepID=UPI002456C2D3|nr:ESX secretion-associated protein EspG [Nocardia flavorosea]
MTKWIWEPDDFAVFWYSDGIDRFPRPLRYLSRFRTRNPLLAHAAAVRARYDREEHELIRRALRTVSHGEMRIEILGSSSATAQGRVREYRIVGSRTAHAATVLAQSAVDGISGPVHAHHMPPGQLPKYLAGLLPACRPGRESAGTFHIDDLGPGTPRERGYARSPGERYRALAGRPADGGGIAILRVGSILDRPDPWFGTQWYDITGDGRYLEKHAREHITVRPAGESDFASGFADWIDRAQRRLREDEPDRW